MDFNITLNEQQQENLIKIGFYSLAEEPKTIMFYVANIMSYLESHNKNYTKKQYEGIQIVNDIFQELYKGY